MQISHTDWLQSLFYQIISKYFNFIFLLEFSYDLRPGLVQYQKVGLET